MKGGFSGCWLLCSLGITGWEKDWLNTWIVWSCICPELAWLDCLDCKAVEQCVTSVAFAGYGWSLCWVFRYRCNVLAYTKVSPHTKHLCCWLCCWLQNTYAAGYPGYERERFQQLLASNVKFRNLLGVAAPRSMTGVRMPDSLWYQLSLCACRVKACVTYLFLVLMD